MKKLLFLSLMALATILLFSCQKENLYSDSEDAELQIRAKKNAETPFKGTYTTYPIISEDGTYAEITGVGNATHLGKSEWYGEGYLDYSVIPPSQEGPCYFVAANKDTLFGYYEGFVITEDFLTFIGEGYCTFTGGTGRFMDASGGSDYNYVVETLEDGSAIGELIWDGILINP